MATPEANRNGKRPIYFDPSHALHPSARVFGSPHDQDRLPLDPVINNAVKRHRTLAHGALLQTPFEALPLSRVGPQRPLLKKPTLGLLFSRSATAQNHKDHPTPFDLLNPAGPHQSPHKRTALRFNRTLTPASVQTSQLPLVLEVDPRPVKDRPKTKEELKKEILQWQDKYRVAIKSFVFYLDRLDAQVETELCAKVQLWGARVDQFFSKDVTHVITDQPVPTQLCAPSPTSHATKRGHPATHQLSHGTVSPSRNKENGPTSFSRRALSRLHGPTQEDEGALATDPAPMVDPLVRKALELKMKIWRSEKLLNVLCRLEDHRSPVKATPFKPSLPSLLLKEAQQGHTHEQDPVAIRPDFYYFPPKAMFIMVEDATQEHKPIIVREYARPKAREATPWPVLWGGTEGKSAFSRYTAKQSYLHVRNRIRAMFEQYAKELGLQFPDESCNPRDRERSPPSEPRPIDLLREKAYKDDIDRVGAPVLEPPPRNLRRTVSMNLLQRRQSARIARLPPLATPNHDSVGHLEDLDDGAQEIDHVNTTLPTHLSGPGKVFLAASGNSIAVTSNLPSAPSTRSSALRTASASRALVDKRLAALGKRPTFQMSQQTPTGGSLRLELGNGEVKGRMQTLRQESVAEDRSKIIQRCQSLDGAMLQQKKLEDHARAQQRCGRKGLGVRAKLGTGFDLLDLRKMVRTEEPKAGYCENCRTKYSDFKRHIITRKHRKFAQEESNWVDLDQLLKKTTRKLKPCITVPPSLREVIILGSSDSDGPADEVVYDSDVINEEVADKYKYSGYRGDEGGDEEDDCDPEDGETCGESGEPY